MIPFYNFITGPLAWTAFLMFIGGTLFRIIQMAVFARKKDIAVYAYMSPYHASRSILHWIVPYASTNMRMHPLFTFVSFVFHICLLAIPLFLLAHVVLVKESWDVSWWVLPELLADVMTIAVVAACIFFAVRRRTQREVRFLTSASDFALLALVVTPFITGFWAQHQYIGFQYITIVHILSGELLLAAIPFTRLSHMFMFPFTRGYMGSEFGAVRHAQDW
jgi:nitrate reductase gamma subunit